MNHVAHIYVNDVKVGSLSTAELEALSRALYRDWRLLVRQGGNILLTGLRVSLRAVRLVPALWLMGGVAAALWAPEMLTETATALAQASPGQVQEATRALLLWSLFLTGTSCVLEGILGGFYRFGYANLFDLARHTAIRKRLGVPATGKLTICT